MRHIPEGLPRKKDNVLNIHALAIDLDKSTMAQVNQILVKLSPYEYFAWTTHKHGANVVDFPRVRIILPLETPITPDQFPSAWQRLDSLIFNQNDPQTKDINRLHYLPSTFDPKQCFNSHNDGRWLSVGDLPDQIQLNFSNADLLRPTISKFTALKKQDTLKPSAVALLTGQSFAEPGERHQTILALTFFIARHNQDLPIEAIEHLFTKSLQEMQTQQDPPNLTEVWDAYTGAANKIKAELKKQQLGDKEPYTQAELVAIAEKQGWKPEELNKRWVLNIRNLLYFLDSNGDYKGPYTTTAWWSASPYYLARAPVDLGRFDNANNYIAFNFDTVVRLHGSPIAEIINYYSRQYSTYDPEKLILHKAICPLNPKLKPVHDSGVANWLQKFAGSDHDKLIDWISCAPDLDKQLCAIYFGGHHGTGKDLFATSLARLWGGPPIKLNDALQNINGAMALNPVVFINEALIIPKKYEGKETDILRMLITENDRVINPKNETNQKLLGMMRFVMAANNEHLLSTKSVATSDALEATAQRIWFIEIGPDAFEMFKTMTLQDKERWATTTIPEHFLWIHKNHTVMHVGERFWVEGDVSRMHRMLMIGSRWNSFVCEWLVMYLKSPQKFKAQDPTGELIRVEEKRLLVNDQALQDGWFLYLKTTIPPDFDKISIALRAISSNKRPQLRTKSGKRLRYRTIILSHLWAWAEQHLVGGLELLKSEVTGVFDMEERHGH
jgi:hypothetical protein